VAENEKLSRGARLPRLPNDAQMIAAMLLREPLDACAMFAPLCGDDGAAAVGVRFLQARRFRQDKCAKDREHLRQTRL